MQPIEFFSALRPTPDSVAVIAPGQRLTFAELAAQTMRVAAYLKAQDPAPQAECASAAGIRSNT
jgi:hypothetical protein